MKITVLVLGSALLAAFVAADAHAIDRFVSRAGSDPANDCTIPSTPCQTVLHALTQATAGDTFKVAGGVGTYADSPVIDSSTTLTFSGGWAPDFASRDPEKHRTTFNRTSFTISADAGETIDVTLDGLQFSKTPVVLRGTGDGALALAVTACKFSGAGGIQARHDGSGSIGLAVTASTFTGGRYPTSAISVFDLYIASLDLSVQESTFTKNRWGALAVSIEESGNTASVSIDRSVFSSNKSLEGGAIFVGSYGTTDVAITNSFFTHNSTTRGPYSGVDYPPQLLGGAIAIDGPDATPVRLVNDTIVKNRVNHAIGGGGLLLSQKPTVDLVNVILRDNDPDDLFMMQPHFGMPGPIANADHDDLGIVVNYQGAGTLNDLGGNLDVAPMLVHGFELASTSPLIDAGTCTGAPPTDLEGDPRPSGGGCDIGADEFVP